MSDQDTVIVKIKWSTIEYHSGYFRVPKGFDPDDYDMGNAMSDHDEETYEWLKRDDFEVYDTEWPIDMEEAIDLDLVGHELE